MTPKETARAAHPTDPPGIPIHLRPAREADLAALATLLVRLKRLNERAREVLRSDLSNPEALVLAAEGTGAEKEKIVGVVRAHLRERMFYAPQKEGVILDIYLLPLFRRRGVGEFMLQQTWELLKARGAGVITAEFPTQNEIAARFYAKRGFRPITALHARQV
jgi:ribosomal protein S18 acetylase RimI-like enzyme